VDYEASFPIITAQAAALAAVGRVMDPDAVVPSCPEWKVEKLLRHTGTAHRWSAGVVRSRRPLSHKEIDLELPGDPAGLPDWLERGAAQLVGALGAADPDDECWTWAGDQHVRFWGRRMAHETSVHRWDGQRAAGEPEPFDGALAVDGIDEHLDNLRFILNDEGLAGAGETLHLHCTDREGEWLLRRTGSGLEVTREHAKGDVALRAAASDLFLLVLGRTPAEEAAVFGDPEAYETWKPFLGF
jgi:uncharacterized protein (TIGR03083 family)